MAEISQEKLDWLESIGAHKNRRPYTWTAPAHVGDQVEFMQYSDEYLSETPLEKLIERRKRFESEA